MQKTRAFLICLALYVLAVVMTPVVAQSTPRPPTATPVPSRILSGHTGGVTALAWSPDGAVLASSSGDYMLNDHAVRLWNANGAPLAVLDSGDRTYSLAWSPDGKTLAAGTEDGTIHLWNAEGKDPRSFGGSDYVVYELDWSPDGKILASGESAGPSRSRVQLWSSDGALLKTLTTEYAAGKFYHVGWSPDGQYLVAGAVSYTLWKADGTPIFTFKGCASCTPSWGFGWSPDSSMWAIGDESGNVFVYSVEGVEIARLYQPGNVDSLGWSSDGRLLAGGSSIWTWDGTTFTRRGGSFTARTTLAWSPTGDLIAASSAQISRLQILDREGKNVATLRVRADSLAWSPDGRTLASGSNDGTIHLWDMTSLSN